MCGWESSVGMNVYDLFIDDGYTDRDVLWYKANLVLRNEWCWRKEAAAGTLENLTSRHDREILSIHLFIYPCKAVTRSQSQNDAMVKPQT